MVQIYKKCCTPKEASLLNSPLDELLVSDLFHALSDPTRNKLLSCLSKCGKPCSVSEIAECCSIDLSVVSRHLSILEAAGILSSKKTGRTVTYSVEFKAISGVLKDLAGAFEDCEEGRAKFVKLKKIK